MRKQIAKGELSSSRQPPRTTCKLCWNPVYEGDETQWVTSPSPGIAHQSCPEQKD